MSTGMAKYVAVRDHLLGRIVKMSAGERLPPEPVLCEEYAVSRITLRRAVDDLIRDGRLVREQGRGTFVTEPRYTHHVRETFADRITGFFRQQTDLGRDVTTQVIQNHVTRQPAAATALGLSPADELIELERMRYVNGTLHQHVMTYVPLARFPRVLDNDFNHGSLYEYLSESYGIILCRNEIIIRLEEADAHAAAALHVSVGQTLLAIQSTVYDKSDHAVAFGVSRHSPANSEIAISLKNQPSEISLPAASL